MSHQADAIDRLLSDVSIMPVIEIDSADDAVPLAKALLEGGLTAIEITLRTPSALEAVRRIVDDVPDMIVGTGTVINAQDYQASHEAGAQFCVSPGLTPTLATATIEGPCPLLPGVATASEAMAALERGFARLKFFPAEAAGGVSMLKSLGGPLSALKFCPTGGITATTAPTYLSLKNVFCLGGSWIAPKDAIKERAWGTIRERAAAAAKLVGR